MKTAKVTSKNYFSREMQLKYMGVSQFKAFEACEAAALAELNGEYERKTTPALLVGSYVDAHTEGTLDIFRAKHPEIFKRDGSLKAEYTKAEEIINRIERDDMMMKYLDGEHQVIMTGIIADVPVKIKIDAFHPGKMIVDQKIMRDFAPIYVPEQGKLTFIEAWGYDLQGAVYQEIVRQNTGKQLPFYIAAATKETETDIGIFEVPQNLLDFELEHFAELAPTYQLMKQGVIPADRCEKCDYCKHTKILNKVISLEELTINDQQCGFNGSNCTYTRTENNKFRC